MLMTSNEEIVLWMTAACCVRGAFMPLCTIGITSASSLLNSLEVVVIVETKKHGGGAFDALITHQQDRTIPRTGLRE